MSSRRTDVSPHSLNRLSLYLRCLKELRARGIERVSSQQLADQFSLSAALIRKDLAQFGEFGIRGVGYEVEPLIRRLRSIMGLDYQHNVAVVGVGRLGGALAGYLDQHPGAFRIVAAFDSDQRKIGGHIGSLPIHDVREIPRIVPATGATIALLTVPPESAQDICSALTEAGIRAILNFAPVQLKVGDNVANKTVDVRIHLEELAFFLHSLAGAESAR